MDRTQLVPPHVGPLVLPNSPFFSKLLRHARRGRVAIRDSALGVERTYGDLLADALAFRSKIETTLSDKVKKRLARDEEVYVGVLASGGYEFAVGVIAVLALGAAIVPISISVAANEAKFFVKKSMQVLLLSAAAQAPLARSIVDSVNQEGSGSVSTLAILPNLPTRPLCSPMDIVISSNVPWDDSKPGVVIFTSGTTGKPKGAVMRRSYIHETALAIGEGYDLGHNDVLLHVLPVHHTTGLGTSFFPYLVVGACVEFRSGSFDPAAIWDRWLQGGITVFSGVPTIYLRLQWHFEREIAKMPSQEIQRYVAAANQLRALKCGSSALQRSVQEFWTKLRNGRPVLTRYGASEFPGCIKVPSDMEPNKLPLDCVGMAVPGVELKLTEGDHGELLVRSPYMFSKYLDDDEATLAAHDAHGYFKTGDICRREGHLYFITGRASVDIIKSGGYKISTLEIERACMELTYVDEAAVVGVDDPEFGQRVGAILSIKDGREVSIQQLRADLKANLASYKMPTLLRLVKGELPKGQTGKVQKKILSKQFLPSPGWQEDKQVQAWRRRTPAEETARL